MLSQEAVRMMNSMLIKILIPHNSGGDFGRKNSGWEIASATEGGSWSCFGESYLLNLQINKIMSIGIDGDKTSAD